MDSTKKSNNKISDIVSLQRILKKWKRIATSNKPASSAATAAGGSNKGIKFIKRTFSFTDVSSAAAASNGAVPKGYVAVSVGGEMKRYVVPTEYLGHVAFRQLLREAEEEFGFQQEGVLRIPCEVGAFEEILKVVRGKTTSFSSEHVNHSMVTSSSDDEGEGGGDESCHQFGFPASPSSTTASADSDYSGVDVYQHYQNHPQMCR
ncbi:Auxin-responsive protein SAUR72 [Linum perenne]